MQSNFGRKLLFSNLSYLTTEQNLIEYFSNYGPIEELCLFKDDQDQSLRRGFLIFYDRHSVDYVMDKRPHTIDQRTIEIQRDIPTQCINTKNISECLGIHLNVNEIFINRVCTGETREMFIEYFQSFGQIVDCRIYKNSKQQTGYAFVRFTDYDSVDRIILSRPHRINSRIYHLRKSIPRDYNYIVSSVKPLSQNKPIWRHFSMGLINTKTQDILYPSTFHQRSNPQIGSTRHLPAQNLIRLDRQMASLSIDSTPKKNVNSANDFEMITARSMSSSSISIVNSSTNFTPLASPLYSTAIAYSPTMEMNCKISSNNSFLLTAVDQHDKQVYELV